jgi:hypothetical protein
MTDFIDHFDGKSLKNKSLDWLNEAFRDAMVKYHGCAALDTTGKQSSEAHAKMWNGIASKYQSEIERRRAS